MKTGHIDSSTEDGPEDTGDCAGASPHRNTSVELGDSIGGRYVLDELLGEGGMGKVYRAHHQIIGKTVAIKVLHPDLAQREDVAARFVREAKTASQIDSPHVVDTTDFGQLDNGAHYFVMEYLDGGMLSELLASYGALPIPTVVDISTQIASALVAAHSLGIVHRDLKPDNLALIERGPSQYLCKVLDFGIAMLLAERCNARLTLPGAVLGTPWYMSPEQAMGTGVDHRTDIYAFGCIVYEMVTGKPPFDAESLREVLQLQLFSDPVPVTDLAPHCPAPLAALIGRCIEKEPGKRPQSMAEVAEELKAMALETAGDLNQPDSYDPDTLTATSMPVLSGDAVPSSSAGLTSARPGAMSGFRRWHAIPAICFAAAGALTLMFISPEKPTEAASATARHGAVTPDRAATPATATPATATPAAAPTAIRAGKVRVVARPTGAFAIVDGKRVDLPTTLDVEEDGGTTILVKHKGYRTASLTLDGSESDTIVDLEKLGSGSPSAQQKAKKKTGKGKNPKKKPPRRQPRDSVNNGRTEIVDPWAR